MCVHFRQRVLLILKHLKRKKLRNLMESHENCHIIAIGHDFSANLTNLGIIKSFDSSKRTFPNRISGVAKGLRNLEILKIISFTKD